jgi:hypothetical protein
MSKGQIAYNQFKRIHEENGSKVAAWEQLGVTQRMAFEAAAQAVATSLTWSVEDQRRARQQQKQLSDR